MRYSIVWLAGFFIFSFPGLQAQDNPDRNIVLQDKTQSFRFMKGKGANPVEIRESYTNVYRCNDYRGTVLFNEMYNDKESIDEVQVKVSERRRRDILPKYDYYSIENIFYSDARVCYLELPLEKKSATSEVSLEKTYADPRYFTSVYFNENNFTENKTVSFYIPRWMNVELKEYNFEGYHIKRSKSYDEKHDEDVITYSMKAMEKEKREPYAPGASYFLPHILVLCKEAKLEKGTVTYFKTVADQYQWYKTLTPEATPVAAAVADKAKELSNNLNSETEKVAAIFNWIQHNIHYLAFEDGIAGFKPAPAAEVFNKKYGDCKGMANLTKNMLAAIGLDARLCWIGTNHIAYDYSTPSLSVDNHMICAWFYKGNKYFLDATETNIGVNEYAERIQNRQVLIEDGEQYILERVPATAPVQNLQREKVSLTVDAQSNLKGTVSLLYKGESRSGLLSNIQQVKKEKLDKVLTNYLSDGNNDYTVSNLVTSDLYGRDSLLKIDYNFYFKNGASAFGNEIYVDVDYRKELANLLIDTAKRRTDRMLDHKMQLVTEVELAVPEGYKCSQLPAAAKWQHPLADISISYKQQNDKVIYKKEITVKQVRLEKEQFASWNKMITALLEQYKEQLVFSKQ